MVDELYSLVRLERLEHTSRNEAFLESEDFPMFISNQALRLYIQQCRSKAAKVSVRELDPDAFLVQALDGLCGHCTHMSVDVHALSLHVNGESQIVVSYERRETRSDDRSLNLLVHILEESQVDPRERYDYLRLSVPGRREASVAAAPSDIDLRERNFWISIRRQRPPPRMSGAWHPAWGGWKSRKKMRLDSPEQE